jgi:tetratricopeptide (TPR) repeat protein
VRVRDSDGQFRHIAFFEALAGMHESDAAWKETTAGLVLLRLADAWLAGDASVVAEGGWGVDAVRSSIAEIDEGRPVRRVLESALDSMVRAGTPDAHVVTPRLVAYAQTLDYDARWALSADVYETVIGYCDGTHDADVLMTAELQLAVAYRTLGDLDRSREHYNQARTMGERSGNQVGVLRADIGFAKLSIVRGNFPQAQALLDGVIERAGDAGLAQVRSMALHDRAVIAQITGDHEGGIRFTYRALADAGSARERDRILADLASAFNELGLRASARDGYLILAATAQEQYTRWAASLNLMELASIEGSEPMFEAYRRELAPILLPPVLAVHFEMICGQSYRRLGRLDVAESHLVRALALAEQHQANDVLFTIESELAELRRAERSRVVVRDPQPSEDVRAIAAAVRAMRERVTAPV